MIIANEEREMRKIKFRGITIDDNKMVYGDLLQYRVYPVIFDKDKNQYEVKANTVGQYTGLKDKNRKMIFEGDIVEIRYIWYGGTDKEKKADYTKIKQIFYNTHSCCFGMFAPEEYDFQMLNSQSMEIEIIGNIYKNPELLKEEK